MEKLKDRKVAVKVFGPVMAYWIIIGVLVYHLPVLLLPEPFNPEQVNPLALLMGEVLWILGWMTIAGWGGYKILSYAYTRVTGEEW